VLDELPLHIEGSAGIALYPDHAADVETLLRKADVAMYAAKAAGGATLYDDGMDQYSPERLTLIHDLRIAIARRELMIEFQPLVDTQTLEPVSYEALVRWDHPDRGRLSPSEFLPLAEQSGLVHDLTSHVLREAVRHAAHWNRQRSEPITVAVNLSARDLHQPQLVALVAAAISEAGLAAEFLELEISENTIVGDPFRTGRVLGDLSSLGVSLAIDDFGAGTTSLQYLRRLPVQTLKIDRTLTAALDDRDDERSVHILSAIIMLAHRLRLRVVGEGVEHPAALEQLRDLGCDLVQGFLVGRPAAAPKPQSLAILDHRHTTRHAPATAASMQPV
jgi:EAL domain-containing protein (putative c-di-GMP-specific phosphodiesterase class I)